MNKNIKKGRNDVYFLNNNEEVKIVTKTMPNKQIFVSNKNGTLLVEDYFTHKERTIKEKELNKKEQAFRK